MAQLGGIKPLKTNRFGLQESYYYKDTDNTFNQFVGTWSYTNGNTSLTIRLKKLTKYNSGSYFKDRLIGEYQYVKNGVELINTLSQFDVVLPYQGNHKISDAYIMFKDDKPFCPDCLTTEQRVGLLLSDALLGVCYKATIRKIIVSGQQAIKLILKTEGIKYEGTTLENMTTSFVGGTIPNGEYILIKQ